MGQIRAWRADDLQAPEVQRVDVSAVKAWFRRLRDMAEAVNIQREKIARQRDAATRVTQNFSGMPSGSGSGDKILDTMCKLDEDERELSRMMTELTTLRLEAIARIFCIVYAEVDSSLRDADILRAYYVECETKDAYGRFKLKTYMDVAAEMNVANSTVSECMGRGLNALAEIWPDISKTTCA